MGAMDELINSATVASLTRTLKIAAPDVNPRHLRIARTGVDGLKLRARTDLVSAALLADLPPDYPAIAGIFRRALADPSLTGWMIWPVTETVTTRALASDDPNSF